jgi:hypothetical protein
MGTALLEGTQGNKFNCYHLEDSMNKRIQEFAEQAGFYYTDKTGFITPAGCDPAKFAELIVRECLTIAKNREDEFESAGLLDESNAVGNVAYRISRQFGVKR